MYHHVFAAGTFEGMHAGHVAFLSAAFEAGERVTVGLTSDRFVQAYKSDRTYLPYAERETSLVEWLGAHGVVDRATVISIDDPYEPAVSARDVDAIMVTRDTADRAAEINARRRQAGAPALVVVNVPLVAAQDRQQISATRIAAGEIDAAGRLTLPERLRQQLAKPIGRLLTGDHIGTSIEAHRNGTVMTVGDITTKMFLTAGVVPNLAIVDFQVARKPFRDLDAEFTKRNLYRVHVGSGPGFIAQEALTLIRKWAMHQDGHEALVVDGEEDLLTIPAIAYGPVGAVVYYGQPNEGLVEVEITREKQSEALALIRQFTS